MGVPFVARFPTRGPFNFINGNATRFSVSREICELDEYEEVITTVTVTMRYTHTILTRKRRRSQNSLLLVTIAPTCSNSEGQLSRMAR